MAGRNQIVFGPDISFAGTEAYKLLRTNLMFALPAGKKCQMIGITSSMRDEGKSTTAVNLAYTIAESGAKVLLVDGDMRLPSIHMKLGMDNERGLSHLLAGMSNLEGVLKKPEGSRNFSLILAGDVPPNPSELLSSKNMEKYMEMWAYYFDYIIFDFPPVGVVTDALVMSEKLDGIIVVVRQNYCLQPSLDDTISKLRYVNANILGVVMTMADDHGKKYKKYYGKYKKGYEYGYGYESIQKSETGKGRKRSRAGKE